MDIEAILLIAGILIGLALWGFRKYQQLNADGKITLDEVLDSVGEVASEVKEAKKEIEEVIEQKE